MIQLSFPPRAREGWGKIGFDSTHMLAEPGGREVGQRRRRWVEGSWLEWGEEEMRLSSSDTEGNL